MKSSVGIANDDRHDRLKTKDSFLVFDHVNKNECKSEHMQGSMLVPSHTKTEMGYHQKPNI
jgi:hypothetical protein